MAHYKPYPKYKNSGIPWLGEMPEHWEVIKLVGICNFIRGNSSFRKDELLSNGKYVALQYGKTYKINEVDNRYNFYVNDEFFKESQIVKQGDVIIISTSEIIEDLGHSVFYNRSDIGLVGGEQVLLRPKKREFSGKYLYYSTKTFTNELKMHATGVKVFRFNIADLKSIYTFTPPFSEQTAIARFLDYKLAKINRFIRKKKQLIKLLNEQKAAIINQAVTKGLDPNAKMKDSGIEWLGEIPESWEVRKLKYLCNITTGNKNTEDKVDNGEYDFFVRSQTVEKINSYSFEGEGILTAGDGVGVGKVFHYANGRFDYHQRVYLFFDFDKRINAKYLFLYLKSHLNTELKMFNAKSTVDSVRLPVLKDFFIAYPDRTEQQKLIDYYEQETATINRTISTIEKEISLVEEYKTALIAEAVTGKIDVRGYEVPEIDVETLHAMAEEEEEAMSMAAEDGADYETEETA